MIFNSYANATPIAVIIDANILFTLNCPVPPSMQIRREHHVGAKLFLDVLSALARRGHAVIVPEMIAFEAACMLDTYRATSEVFSASKYDETSLQRWFRANRESVLIQRLPPHSTSLASRLMSRARKAMKYTAVGVMREAIIEINAAKKAHPNLGEDAAIELGEVLAKRQPTFFVTCDFGAADKARASGLQVLSLHRTLVAMLDAGILAHADISATNVTPVISQLRSWRPQAPIALPPRDHDAETQAMFVASIMAHGRADELVDAPDKASTDTQKVGRSASGQDRFKKRFGWVMPGPG